MVLGTMLALVLNMPYVLSLVTIVSFLGLAFSQQTNLNTLANMVTLFRFLLIVGASFGFAILDDYYLLAILIIAVSLDGLDGHLARKHKQSSVFGQYFDMEVDAFFVLLMCIYYYLFRDIGWWILVPGLMRYIYVIVLSLFPKTNFVEKKKKYATYIAGFFFVILCAGLILPAPYNTALLLIGTGMIIFSFSISIKEFIIFKIKQSNENQLRQ